MGKARAECQGAAQPPINPRDISLFFCVLGLWTNKKKKKTFKTHLEEPETAVCYGPKMI